MNSRPTIFAELTPPGRGGITTIALLGSAARDALTQVFCPRHPTPSEPGRLFYGHIVSADGTPLDEVIVSAIGGEGDADEREIHCHGGPAAVEAVTARLTEVGLVLVLWVQYLAARAARAGVSQIVLESELLLPELTTLPASLVIVAQRNGLLAEAVLRATNHLVAGDRQKAAAQLDALMATYQTIGCRLECPPRVAILGPANVGKSSLLNRLVGRDRAIVDAAPGTTRDVVTERADLRGLPVVLADTAGLRAPGDAVEQLGIERARAEALHADVLLVLVDLSRPPTPDEAAVIADRPAGSLLVGSKADLPHCAAGPSLAVDVATSAVTGQGLDELSERILTRLAFRWPALGEAVPFTARQADALRAAKQALYRGSCDDARRHLDDLVAPPRDVSSQMQRGESRG